MEVKVKLRFIQPCYGNERGEKRDLMLREDGKVIFKKAWWIPVLSFAANAIGRWFKEVKQIDIDPVVEGQTVIKKRWYSAKAYKEHEAFDSGAIVETRFWLPNEISPDDFRELLSIAGRYKGLSPYGHSLGLEFGKFSVLSVEPVIRVWDKPNASEVENCGESGSANPVV